MIFITAPVVVVSPSTTSGLLYLRRFMYSPGSYLVEASQEIKKGFFDSAPL